MYCTTRGLIPLTKYQNVFDKKQIKYITKAHDIILDDNSVRFLNSENDSIRINRLLIKKKASGIRDIISLNYDDAYLVITEKRKVHLIYKRHTTKKYVLKNLNAPVPVIKIGVTSNLIYLLGEDKKIYYLDMDISFDIVKISGVTNIVLFDTTNTYAVCVTEKGICYMINRGPGQLPTWRPIQENVKKVSCGYEHVAILTHDGKIYVLGSRYCGILKCSDESTPTLKLENIKDVECAGTISCVVTVDNVFYAWEIRSTKKPERIDSITSSNPPHRFLSDIFDSI